MGTETDLVNRKYHVYDVNVFGKPLRVSGWSFCEICRQWEWCNYADSAVNKS